MRRFLIFSSPAILSLFGIAIAQDQPSSWLDVNPTIYIPPSNVDPPYSSTSEAVTSTVESRPVITTIAVPYSVSTATADAGALKKGDLLVEFSPDFRKHLLDVAKTACGAPGSKREETPTHQDLTPRDAAACRNMGQFMSETIGDGAPGGLDIIGFNSRVITANDMEAGIRRFFVAGRTLYKSRLWIGGISMVWLGLYLDGKINDANQPIVVPQAHLGEPTGSVAPGLPTSTSTGSSCKATKTGSTAPICEDKNGCNGMAQKTCVVDNEDHLCPCSTLNGYYTHPIDVALITAQQQILQTVMNSPAPVPTTPCYYGAQPRDEDGPAGIQTLPTKWCACGTKTYSVATSGELCPYTKTPGAEVTFTITTKGPATTQRCKDGPFQPPDWVIKRNDVLKAAEAFCQMTVDQQSRGSKVADNWPGRCAWVFDGNVKKMTAALSGTNMCPGTVPVIGLDSCKASFKNAIDNCDVAQPAPDNYKRGGTYGERCMLWSWFAAPYEAAGYPCIGQYDGPDKPPITKRDETGAIPTLTA